MAFVSAGWETTMNLVDTSGSISQLLYHLTSADAAEALTDSAAVRLALEAVSLSKVSAYRITQVFVEDAFTLPADAENAIKAEVAVFLNVPGIKRATFRIPAPEPGIFIAPTGAGFNVVDVGDAELQTYASLFLPTGACTISDGESIKAPVTDALDKGRRISVKSRNP